MNLRFSLINKAFLIIFFLIISIIIYIFMQYLYITPQLKKQFDNILYSNQISQKISYGKISYYPLIGIIKISNLQGPFFNIKELSFKNSQGISLTISELNINIIDIARNRIIKGKNRENLALDDLSTELVILGYNNLKGDINLELHTNDNGEVNFFTHLLFKGFAEIKGQGEIIKSNQEPIKVLQEGILSFLINIFNGNVHMLSQTILNEINLKDILISYKDDGVVYNLKQFASTEEMIVPSVEKTKANELEIEKRIGKFLIEYNISSYFTAEQKTQMSKFWLNPKGCDFSLGKKQALNLEFLFDNINNGKNLLPYFYQSGASLNCEANKSNHK